MTSRRQNINTQSNISQNNQNQNQNNESLFSKITKPIFQGVNFLNNTFPFLSVHGVEISFLLGLLVYVIIVSIIYSRNPWKLINESNGGMNIFLTLLGGFLLVMGYILVKKRKEASSDVQSQSTLSYFGRILMTFFLFGALVVVLYFVFNFASYYSDLSGFFQYLLNFLIIISLVSLVIKYFNIQLIGEPKDKKPSFFGLIKKVIFYLPCILIEFVDFAKTQINITTRTDLIIFAILISLIIFYFVFGKIMEQSIVHNAQQLVKYPIGLNILTDLGTFQKINFKKDNFNYNYAISGWFFINSFPPETNPNYEKYTSLLNIGNVPNILFNPSDNKLKIEITQEGKTNKVIYKSEQFGLQKWNHILVNYDGKIMDIFINNELVASVPGIIPYNSNTVVTCGHDDGIYGGITNVLFYKENLTRGKIKWLYNSVKNLNPPVI